MNRDPLTLKQVARGLNMSEAWLRTHAATFGGIRYPGAKVWRFPPDTIDRFAPQCQPKPQESESTNAPPESGASSGATTEPNAKNAATPPRTPPTSAQPTSAGAFVEDFPEFAKVLRSAG